MAKASDLIAEYLNLRDVVRTEMKARHRLELEQTERRMTELERVFVAHNNKHPDLTSVPTKQGYVTFWEQHKLSMKDPAKVKDYILEEPEQRIVLLQNRLAVGECETHFTNAKGKVDVDLMLDHGINSTTIKRAKFNKPRKKS